MSGITGLLNLSDEPVDGRLFQRMVDATAHRGPDGVATWLSGPIALGNARFVTTPEDADVQQPLTLGPLTITCDGFLSNRDELTGLLEADRQCSDSELILRSYEFWGTECVDRLSGDFAFAIWDERNKQLFCARDALGIRVLHYYYDGRRFAFSTEIKGILAHPVVPRRLNEGKVGQYLALDEGDAEQTFYERIYRLPGGCALTVSRAGLSKRTYWDPPVGEPIDLASRLDYADRFYELFEQAISSRMRSTEPVGVMLSGGLDSSSIYGTAHEILRRAQDPASHVQSFSWRFNELATVDESSYVRDLLDRYPGTAHVVDGDNLWGMRAFDGEIPPRDEPFIAPYDALIRTTMERAREAGVRVLMTGQGGDEFLYTREHYLTDLLKSFKLRRFRQEFKYIGWDRRWGLYRRLAAGLVPALVRDLLGLGSSDAPPPWMDPALSRRVKVQMKDGGTERRYGSRYVQSQYGLVEVRGRSSWVMWANQAAHHQVEMRHPFYDRRLVEFMVRIPPKQKYYKDATKAVMRMAMRDILPESILLRGDKASFLPLFERGGEMELDGLRQKVEAGASRLVQSGFVSPRQLSSVLGQSKRGDYANGLLFMAFIVEEWLGEIFEGNGGYSSPLLWEQALPVPERR